MRAASHAGDPLLAWRSEFPILEQKTYLISNSLGAMPRKVYESLHAYADKWATEGVLAWHDWVPMVLDTGNLIGRIINAPKDTVIMHQNVSTLQAIIASCLDFSGKRNKVVYDDLNFPSVHYVWMGQRGLGARVVIVPSDDGIAAPTERLLEAIDDETLIVPISHVLFRSAYIQEVEAIIEKAHRVGAMVCLDSYQATGTVPIDVQRLNVDMLCGGSVKWLCGGPGAAYLYVRPDLIKKLEPRASGWFSHPEPFAFEMGEMRYADDAMRFMGGSPSVPALYAARCGYEIILEVGVEGIREKSVRQTSRLFDAAERAGFRLNSPRDPARRGGTVCIDFDGAEQAHHELIRRGYIVDHRPRCGVRISPHFYTRDDEIDACLDELVRIREEMRRAR